MKLKTKGTEVGRPSRANTAVHFGYRAALLAAIAILASACGTGDEAPGSPDNSDTAPSSSASVDAAPSPTTASLSIQVLDGRVDIGGGRSLYVRCSGAGSPTVVLEGGDGDTSDSYLFAEERLAMEARTCVYDRANLGQSDPAPGPRGLPELVGDLEALLQAAEIPGPYVLVGT